MKYLLYILTMILGLAITPEILPPASGDTSGPERPRYQFRGPYFQRQTDPISFDRPITCVFQTYSVAGYEKKEILYKEPEILERADITPDQAPNVWKITLHDKTADLIIAGGGWESITNETWTVVSRTSNYLILSNVGADGETIRTITINARYGTFVQCFNGELFGVNHGVTHGVIVPITDAGSVRLSDGRNSAHVTITTRQGQRQLTSPCKSYVVGNNAAKLVAKAERICASVSGCLDAAARVALT